MKSFPVLFLIINLYSGFAFATDKEGDEEFDKFHSTFLTDINFRDKRTKFPISITTTSGYGEDGKKITRVTKKYSKTALNEENIEIYTDPAFVKSLGYKYIVKNIDIRTKSVLVSPEGSEPLITYIFKLINKKWFLIELIEHENS